MAKRTTTNRRRVAELPEELALRKLRAKAESQMIRSAMKVAKAQLSIHEAARVSRKTKDWKAPLTSADAAILADSTRLNARARQLVRDSWIAKSAVRAKARNICGTGIIPVPAARIGATEMTAFNNAVEKLFWDWASDRGACDVEARSTFWQMQTACVEERTIVGERFIVWSYRPHPEFVGLQLQGFEPEQLDSSIQSFNGNEVRNGIEVDGLGRAIAYHFYERTPNDYLSTKTQSIRVPANRVLHYFKSDRAQQSHGVTDFAPVMMDVRDFTSFKDAMLFRAKMEACIGFVIRKNFVGSLTAPAGIAPASGDSTTLSTGERVIDMAPGMTPELLPGEDIEPFIPSSPGNNYQPFTETTLRGIGAGMGLSYGAIARKSDGNYSSARQDMLEDERELGPEQDLLIDIVVKGVYELFVMFAVAEGRATITPDAFTANRRAFVEAEYVKPGRPWIDPEKEANAAEKMISLRLTTRKEIRGKMGGRMPRTLQQIADERTQAKTLGIEFPEDVSKEPAAMPPQAQPPKAAPAKTLAARLAQIPNYRAATVNEIACATCRYLQGCRCTAYDEPVAVTSVCDAWEVPPVSEATATPPGRMTEPPGPDDGEKPFDQTSARDEV